MAETESQQSLILLLEEKLTRMHELLNLTRAQEDTLKDEEVESFLWNLDERQAAMDAIDELDRRAAKLAAEMKGSLPSAERADENTLTNIARVGELTKQTKAVLASIIELDKKNAALARQKLDSVRDELRETRESIRSDKTYNPPPIIEDGVYFDTKK